MFEKQKRCSLSGIPCVEMFGMTTSDAIGTSLAVAGSTISVLGTLANNIWLNHNLAMGIWMISNPILLGWAYGNYKKWWNGGLSFEAVGCMYAIFTITNFYGLFFGGLH
jgi:hypothetical protein